MNKFISIFQLFQFKLTRYLQINYTQIEILEFSRILKRDAALKSVNVILIWELKLNFVSVATQTG